MRLLSPETRETPCSCLRGTVNGQGRRPQAAEFRWFRGTLRREGEAFPRAHSPEGEDLEAELARLGVDPDPRQLLRVHAVQSFFTFPKARSMGRVPPGSGSTPRGFQLEGPSEFR